MGAQTDQSKIRTGGKLMKFNIGDRVRVVTAISPFYRWTGEVCGRYNGEFVSGVRHYDVMVDALPEAEQPLLFVEEALAFAE